MNGTIDYATALISYTTWKVQSEFDDNWLAVVTEITYGICVSLFYLEASGPYFQNNELQYFV